MDDVPLLRIRPLRGSDASAARLAVLAELGGTPYAEPALAAVELAQRGATGDAAGLVAEHRGELVGVVVFGEVAGALGAGRLLCAVVADHAQRRTVGEELCEAAIAELARRGARFVLAEVPDDARLTSLREVLRGCGFSEEGRVPDYFTDGVALTFWRRDLASGK